MFIIALAFVRISYKGQKEKIDTFDSNKIHEILHIKDSVEQSSMTN